MKENITVTLLCLCVLSILYVFYHINVRYKYRFLYEDQVVETVQDMGVSKQISDLNFLVSEELEARTKALEISNLRLRSNLDRLESMLREIREESIDIPST